MSLTSASSHASTAAAVEGGEELARCMIWICVGRLLEVSALGVGECVEDLLCACWSSGLFHPMCNF